MKKSIIGIATLLCALFCVFGLFACDDDPDTKTDISVTGVELSETSLTLAVGDEETLTATVLPNNATDKTVVWISDRPNVATVENGKVTALAVGLATITASAGGKSAECSVTVTAAPLTEQTDFETLESDKVTEAEWDAAFTNEAFAGVTVKYTRGEMEMTSKFGYEANSDGFDFSIKEDSTYKGTPYFSQEQIAHVVGDVATLYGKNLNDPDDENIYFMTQDLTGEDGVVMKEWSLTYRFGVAYDFAGAFELFEYDETLHAYTYNGSDLKCKYSPMEAMGEYTVENATLKFIGGKLAYAKVKITLDSEEEVFRYYDYGKTQVVIPENALPYGDATN